jgi:2-C-methyl-D-erythritol 4-phosphate cytidylyltransferase
MMIMSWCMMLHVHVSAENLKELADYCVERDTAAILAIPVRDTLKFATDQHIQNTVSRDHLWQAQTPQMAKWVCFVMPLKKH